MKNNNKMQYNGNGMDHPNIHRNPLFVAFKKAGVDDMTAVEAVLSTSLLGSHIATKEDLANALANHPTKEDMKQYPTKEDMKQYPTKEDMKQYPTKEDMKQYPTKEDLQKAINTQTKWMVGTVIAVGIMIVGLLM